ncbi:MAG: anaerobic glycerol-3-phosphate dehydrogenase subunit GlpB [Candidatus Lernaella stagnicola]|nr:anaerobic glycerol-3-phosphate dehydrogenase subunit GlpB [Candidatus Lernaella stagnicola]
MTRVLVIGGGLAGLTAAREAARRGAEVTLLTSGQGMHHLFSGCIDVLAYPPGSAAASEVPLDAVAEVAKTHPQHPYAKVGVETVESALEDFREAVAAQGLEYRGDGRRLVRVLTVLGAARPTALIPATMDAAAESIRVVCNINLFQNFSSEMLARELSVRHGHAVAALDFQAEPLRRDPLGVAVMFHDERFAELFGRFLEQHAAGQTVAVPALLGRREVSPLVAEIEATFGGKLVEVPGQPPSLPGLRLFAALRRGVLDAGVRIVQGARAVGPLEDPARLRGVMVKVGHAQREQRADAVVLATGHLVGGGIIGDRAGLREPLFDLPVSGEAGPPFFSKRFLDPGGHPSLRTGVAVDESLRPLVDGKPKYENLFAAGDILADFDPYCERSGGAVALATGMQAGREAAGGGS